MRSMRATQSDYFAMMVHHDSMRWIAAIPAVWALLGFSSVATAQPAFPGPGDDNFQSKLTFKVTLSSCLGGQTFNITMAGPTCVARSGPHSQAADPSGPMGSGSCAGGSAGAVGDATIGLPFPAGFNAGGGVDELHTRMMNLNLNGGGWTLRAGASAPSAGPSYGEVESRGAFGFGGPGADSFFNIFFEMDVPASVAPPTGLTLYNADALTVQANGLSSLPPAGSTYIHSHTIEGRVMLFDRVTGCFVGWIEEGGHGVGTTEPPHLPQIPKKLPLVFSVDCLAEGLLVPGPCGLFGHCPPNDVFALGMVTGQGAWGYATEGEVFQSSGKTLGVGPDMTNIDRFASALGISPAPGGAPPYHGPFSPNPGAPHPAPAPPGAGVGTFGLVPRDNMDALSFGRDRGDTLLFSVSPASVGVGGSAVNFQSALSPQAAAIGGIGVVPSNGGGDPGDEAAGDIFISSRLAPFPPPGHPIIPLIPPTPLLAPAAAPFLNNLYHDELDLGLQAPAIRHSALCQTTPYVSNPGGGAGASGGGTGCGGSLLLDQPAIPKGIGMNVPAAREIIAASGIKPDDAEILHTSTLTLPTLQDELLLAKVIDRNTGETVTVALDKLLRPTDPDQAQADELSAYESVNGKLHDRLVDRVKHAGPDEKIRVVIWLDAPDTTPAVAAVQAQGFSFDGLKPTGDQSRQARSALIHEKAKIYESHNAPMVAALIAMGGQVDYASKLAPLVCATLTPAQIAQAEKLVGVERIYESVEHEHHMETAGPSTTNGNMILNGFQGNANIHVAAVELTAPAYFANPFLDHLNGQVYRKWYRVTVKNSTGQNAGRLEVTFNGSGNDVHVSPPIIIAPNGAPVCSSYTLVSNGAATDTAIIDLDANCVNNNESLTFAASTKTGPLTFASGQWKKLDGTVLGAVNAGDVTVPLPELFDEHATNTAGCIGGSTPPNFPAGAGMGISPEVNMFGANALDGFDASIIDAMEWAVLGDAEVINMSLGGDTGAAGLGALDKYVDHTIFEHYIAVVISAGNSCAAIYSVDAVADTTANAFDAQVVTPPGAVTPYIQAVVVSGPDGIVTTVPQPDDFLWNPANNSCKVNSPGLAYSCITVGAIDDLDTVNRADDERAPYSSWIDIAGDYEKPEVSAPGSRIRVPSAGNRILNPAQDADLNADGINDAGNYAGTQGTSFSAPIVAGYVADMIDMDSSLQIWPETTKAVALASAKHNTYDNAIENYGGAVQWDGKEGAGSIIIDEGHDIISKGHYDKNTLHAADFPRMRIVSARQGERFRYAIAWSSHTSGGTIQNVTNDDLTADLDLYVYDCHGRLITWSTTFNNGYEVVSFDSPNTQNYRVEIRAYRFDATFEYLGEAWNADDPLCEEDNLDALEVSDGAVIDVNVDGIPDGNGKYAFFSIKAGSPSDGSLVFYAASSSPTDPGSVTPDDILVSPPPGGPAFARAIYASGIGDIGLLPGDDIDALVLLDNLQDGRLQPGLDIALISLAPGSPTLLGINPNLPGAHAPSDVFLTDFTLGGAKSLQLYATSAMLGLISPDDLDALDIGGELPPPCPHGTPSTPGTSYVSFGTGGSNPALPAGFFGPGSDPFVGQINLKGEPLDTATYGTASMLAQRSNEATLADDPVGAVRTVDLEITALSLVSIQPIVVTSNGGQNPEHWDVRVGLSPSVVPLGSLTAHKTHANGGTFNTNLPVQPFLTFTRVSGGPPAVVTLDTGEQGLPPHFFTSQDTPYVHTLDASMNLIAPSNGTFVPGVLESVPGNSSSQVAVQWTESDLNLPAVHTVEPPVPYITTLCPCPGDFTGDNAVTVADVFGFVSALINFSYDPCADMDGFGSDDGIDIHVFVEAVLSSTVCTPTLGACCYPDTSCADQSASACYSGGGQFQGQGTQCETTTCPQYKTVPPGRDCWTTDCGNSHYQFSDYPIPAGFFGPGSDPFTGLVQLGGVPILPGGADTSVQRHGSLYFPDPLPAVSTVPIEIVEMSLTCCQPIIVTYNGGQNPQQWNLAVGLSPTPAPLGTMTVTKNDPTGGTFDTVLYVQPLFTFTSGANSFEFDTGAEGISPMQLTGTGHPWLQSAVPGTTCSPGFAPGYSNPSNPCCPESCHSSFGTAPHDHCVRPPECPHCVTPGACCLPGGGCLEGTTSGDCGIQGGSYQGDNTTCAGSNCTVTLGACCLPGGGCLEGTTSGNCGIQGGVFHGALTCAQACPVYTCIPAGDDCWVTPCPGTNYSFTPTPLPAGFFGPGSDPFTGTVILGGNPIGPFGTDTLIHRSGDLCFPQPPPSSASVPIQLVQLSLTSCQPISVTYNGGQNPEQWTVQVDLSPTPAPSGTLTATQLTSTGGTFDSIIVIQPRFTFVRLGPPATVVFDTGAESLPPMQIGSTGTPWTTQAVSGSSCSPGFHPGYTDEPTPCCPETCHSSFGTAPHDHCVRPPECPHCVTPGACCLPGGGCLEGTTSGDCGIQGGSYQGDNTTCAGSNCTVTLGACCLPGGGCLEGTTSGNCGIQGGVFHGALTCAQACPASPFNNDCSVAYPIFDGVTPFTTVGATTDGPDHSTAQCQYANPVYNNVWFSYTASCTGSLTVSTCQEIGGGADYDTRIAVYSTTNCGLLSTSLAGCNDDDPLNPCGTFSGGYHSTVTVSVVAGSPYLFSVGGYGETDEGNGSLFVSCVNDPLGRCCSSGGTICNDVTASTCSSLDGEWLPGTSCSSNPCVLFPANDDCANAIPISDGVTPFSTYGANTDGPNHTSVECQFNNPIHNNTWYTYTASCTGVLTVTTCEELGGGSNYDSRIAVYSTTDCGSLATSLAGCNDDDPNNPCGGEGIYHSTVTAPVTAGNLYLFSVGAYGTLTTGSGLLNVYCTQTISGACCFAGGGCGNDYTSGDCSLIGGSFMGPDSVCSTYQNSYYTPVFLSIPDNNPTGITSVVSIPEPLPIYDVDVMLNISHLAVGNLCVSISHNATTVDMIQRMTAAGACHSGSPLGCPQDNLVNVILDDEGVGGTIESKCVLNLTSPPNYTPNNPLSAFDGQSAGGNWSLSVRDMATGNTGVLNDWTLILTFDVGCVGAGSGACCYPGGDCLIQNQSECIFSGGFFQGPSVSCFPGLCP